MERDRVVVGAPLGAMFNTNCFIVADRARGGAVVVDPGQDGDTWVPQVLADLDVQAEVIALTHGHLDHLWSVPALARTLDVPVLLHPDDRWLWDDPAAGFGASRELLEQRFGLSWDPPADRLQDVGDGDVVSYAGLAFQVVHNPGHTPGHVTYLGEGLADAELRLRMGGVDALSGSVLFSGDLLFAGSVGRTDLPRGSTRELYRSLVETVVPLEDDVVVLSGHGPATTVGRERARNPFLAEAVERLAS